MKRLLSILCILVAALFGAVLEGHAQEIPGMESWRMDSVVRGSIYKYTVYGDQNSQNYADPSTFIWVVKGGRLFTDSVSPAPNVNTMKVFGNNNIENKTELYVMWDQFTQPRDTGYVYVHEITNKGCEYDLSDPRAYQGMRIKVSAPPKARFLDDVINLCSYDGPTNVIMEINGMAPFDVTYSIDGVQKTMHLNQSDLTDLDGDGEANNLSFPVTGFTGTTTELSHRYELIEASSGGVVGSVLDSFPVCNVYIHVQPPKPVIFVNNIEVTSLDGNERSYQLITPGVNATEYYWYLYRTDNDSLVAESLASNSIRYDINWSYAPGEYYLIVNYVNGAACESPFDTLRITAFDPPTIRFSLLTPDVTDCSALIEPPHDKLQFQVDYTGALTYDYGYVLKDYNGNIVPGTEFHITNVNARTSFISFDNILMNTEQPPVDRTWTLEIVNPKNYEGIDVEIVDGIRNITIHPKPIIEDDIDFYN